MKLIKLNFLSFSIFLLFIIVACSRPIFFLFSSHKEESSSSFSFIETDRSSDFVAPQASKLKTFTKEMDFSTEEKRFDFLVNYYCEKYDIEENLIRAIAQVETKKQNVIGDGHLKNHAYGYFQLRQPAIDEVNRIYEFNKIKKAEDIFNDIESQIEYTILFVKHLKNLTKNEKEAISAYNIGLSNVKKGKYGNYYAKVVKEIEETK